MKKFAFTIIAILLLTLAALPFMVDAQSAATWIPQTGFLKPFNATYGIRVPSLASSGDCITTDAQGDFVLDTCGTGGGTGTVESVDMTVPTGLSISGNPITTTGTLALTLTAGYNIPLTASTTAWNTFYTTPSNRITAGTGIDWSGNTLNGVYTAGDAITLTGEDFDFDGGATPSGDLGGTWASPSVTDDSHNHTSATLSGIDISADTNLGVTATGLSLSGDNVALTAGYNIPLTASTTAWNTFYTTPSTRITAGTGLSWSGNTLNASAGTGDVVGPASAVDNAVTRFDTTTGKLVQNSGVIIDDTANIFANSIYFENGDTGTGAQLVGFNGPGSATINLPSSASTLATLALTETLTNKTLTSARITTNLSPTSNDGAALGTTALQFSDLFLAEGGVINWDNGDLTLTQTGNVLAVAGGDLQVPDDVYAAGWNASVAVATKNAIYDIVETLGRIAGQVWTGTHNFGGATVTGLPYYPAFSYATTTAWTGTTTRALGPAFNAQGWESVKCFTDAGTVKVQFGDGTNWMTLLNASTTVGTVPLTSNNTFTASEKRYVRFGTPATSPKELSCSVKYQDD